MPVFSSIVPKVSASVAKIISLIGSISRASIKEVPVIPICSQELVAGLYSD